MAHGQRLGGQRPHKLLLQLGHMAPVAGKSHPGQAPLVLQQLVLQLGPVQPPPHGGHILIGQLFAGRGRPQRQGDRAVVGAKDVRVVGDALHHGQQRLGDQEVVQPPAPVFQPLVQTHGPPGIGPLHLGVPGPEHVRQPQGQQPFHPLPFQGLKARRLRLVA